MNQLMNIRTRIYRLLIVCLPALAFANITFAQLSVQIAPGIMNYGGDIQNKIYTFQEGNFAISGTLIYSFNKFSARAGMTFGKVMGDDLKGTGYETRNLSFNSNITEGSAALQYDLFLLDDNHKITPYAFAGVGVFHFDPYTYYDSQKVYLQPLGTEGQGLPAYPDKKVYSLTQFEIPFGVGVKYKLSERFLIGIEFCSRFLFTDYLDDISTTYPDENELFKGRGQLAVDVSYRGDEFDPSNPYPLEGAARGNPSHNDNYYTTTFTLTYVFSEHSFFNNGSGGKKNKAVNCPKNVF